MSAQEAQKALDVIDLAMANLTDLQDALVDLMPGLESAIDGEVAQ